MPVPVRIVAVANMHGLNQMPFIGKMLGATNRYAFSTHTGQVFDAVTGGFATVTDYHASAASVSPTDCRRAAYDRVRATLGTNYTVSANALPAETVHIWVRGEGWVIVPAASGFSHAFQLQVDVPKLPVDVRWMSLLNGTLHATDVLVVVQST